MNCIADLQTYDPSLSPTSIDTGRTFEVSFLDGSTASGEVYLDTMQLGTLTASRVPIGRSAAPLFPNHPTLTGICGMSLPHTVSFGMVSFFVYLLRTGVLARPLFAFALSRGTSQMTIGGLDSTAYSGNIEYVPTLKQTGTWDVMASIQGLPSIPMV